MKKLQTVFVRNNGTIPFKDRYDGEEFEIEPGEYTEMLIECAQLCMGFGDEDKTRCIRRLGWAFTQNGMAEALQRLETFSFHMERPKNGASKPGLSSAPEGEDARDVVSPSSRAVVLPPGRKLGPLEKLAQANAAAG
jgi:hypothetical protein